MATHKVILLGREVIPVKDEAYESPKAACDRCVFNDAGRCPTYSEEMAAGLESGCSGRDEDGRMHHYEYQD